jgi:hypothetical protein
MDVDEESEEGVEEDIADELLNIGVPCLHFVWITNDPDNVISEYISLVH